MAEIIASELVKAVLQKLASEAMKKIVRSQGIQSELKNLERTFSQIQALLNDASQKEVTNEAVKRWLNSLQHLAYNIDDILDGLATEAMKQEFSEESVAFTSKVRKLIPTCCTDFSLSTGMRHKLDHITKKLQALEMEKNTLGLIVKDDRPKYINRKFQTSVVHESKIVGRQVEKEALVHKLLRDEPCDENFSIVPIVGMGGVGKTTLARLLYDENRVKDHFELKAWVCVSDDFDSFSISKVIFQSVGGENKEFADFNLLQVALNNQLMGKRFLLVLDDVWSESREDWETLVGPFLACAPGSKIIMTTRKEKLLTRLGYNNLNHLQNLSHDDATSLFAKHALGASNLDSHPTLKPHGEGIVEKCDGLPLALIALGGLLSTKGNDEEFWEEVLNSEIWRFQVGGEILPALRLSYHDLSACLKKLFVYCSLFPKDFIFHKEELVLLWMAEGFLEQSTQRRLTKELLGREYFEELLSRSFFQYVSNDKSLFVMHDLMNDLATSVAGEFLIRLESETKKNLKMEVLEKYRHISFVRERYGSYKKFESFAGAKYLRTFLAVSAGQSQGVFHLSNKVLVDLLPHTPFLRVLSLSKFDISEVPESIGCLRHLRYLNLSHTRITHLPENVCNLYNLQTLILFRCYSLANLPNNFSKLKNLRHFDIGDTPCLNKMPIGISELKSLQTLSKIIIGSRFEILKLKQFSNLCGKVSIEGLDKVQNAIDAREATFSQKRISELEVKWSDGFDGFRKEIIEKEVLDELKPYNDTLKKLKIESYGGIDLPYWIGDPSFARLTHVSIDGCKKCTSLPPLGQLPSLEKLFIGGMDGVNTLGLELLGTGVSFSSLKVLCFENMKGWEVWSTNGGVVFPCLEKLFLRSCCNLVEVSLEALPLLRHLEISGCNHSVLTSLVQVASSVTELEIKSISGLNDEVWRGVIEYLGAVEELRIQFCTEIRYLWESVENASAVLVSLRKLEVSFCHNLVSLGEREDDDDDDRCRKNLLTSLKILDIVNCNSMECCMCPNNIETLNIQWCSSITDISFSSRGGAQKLKSLNINDCKKLMKNELGGYEGGDKSQMLISNNKGMPFLEYVNITDMQNLKFIVDLNCFVHLTSLEIGRCQSLESFPDHHLPNLTSLKDLEIRDCSRMDGSFPRGLWPPNLITLRIGKLKKPISEWGPQNFPQSLVDLTLDGGPSENNVNSCRQLSCLLPSSLTTLKILSFKKLKTIIVGLEHLTSLQRLVFGCCPKVKDLREDLPEMLLPSLLSLKVFS